MSDELNKFVLEYVVQTKNSLRELEKLTKATDGIEKSSKKAGDGLKNFASGAVDEIGKMVPGLNAAKSAVAALGAEFGVAAVAVGVLAGAIKATMDMREQINGQRLQAQSLGLGPMQVESMRRDLRANSGGRVNESAAAEATKTLGSLYAQAKSDPTFIGTTAGKQLALLGLNVRNIGSSSQFFNQIGANLSKRGAGEAQGIGMALGLSADASQALRSTGATFGNNKLSDSEVINYQKNKDAVADYDKALSDLNEKYREAAQVIGEKILPAITKLVDYGNKIVGGSTEQFAKGSSRWDNITNMASQGHYWDATKAYGAALVNTLKESGGVTGKIGSAIAKGTGVEKSPEEDKKAAQAAADGAKKLADAAREQEQKTTDLNDEGLQSSIKFNTAVNLFNAAVMTFANAIDVNQAWAAWAGEIGKAAGLGSPNKPGASATFANNVTASKNGKFDDYFAAASKATGIPVEMLKAIGKNESNFNPKALSSAGAQGVMQVMPANFKSLGITDGYDPQQNIMGGAKLFASYVNQYGSYEAALRAYNSGTDQNKWSNKGVVAYQEKVMGTYAANMTGSGAVTPTGLMSNVNNGILQPGYHAGMGLSKEDIMKRQVAQTYASAFGVDVKQVLQGQINRGDMAWKTGQLEAGINNGIFSMQKELMNPMLPATQRAKLTNEIALQQRGLTAMQQYSGGFIDNARPGDRQITIGERAIVVNINGIQDPQAVGDAVHSNLRDHLGEIVNGQADGISH